MKHGIFKAMVWLLALFAGWTLVAAPAAGAGDVLRYSVSAQIYEAFGQTRLDAFTQETGVKVDLYVSSSGSAIYRLMNDFSDLAGSVRGLYYRHKESGYVEIPFCKDPLAVIVNAASPVKDLTADQIQGIFAKSITTWKAVGGPDRPIIVIAPGKDTAAFKNFERMAMAHKEILYDYMSYKSTMVISAVENFPDAISFISQGDIFGRKGVKAVAVGGLGTRDKDYPYYQTFYYITKGQPQGPAKQFIDFTLSDKGITLMKEKGMVPMDR